jgi:hypothetical protein
LRNLLPPFSEDVGSIFLENWATFSVSGNDATSAARLYSTGWQDYRWTINEKDLGWSSHGLIKVISWHLPEGLKKTMKTLSQDSWCPGQYSNWAISEYETNLSTAVTLPNLYGHTRYSSSWSSLVAHVEPLVLPVAGCCLILLRRSSPCLAAFKISSFSSEYSIPYKETLKLHNTLCWNTNNNILPGIRSQKMYKILSEDNLLQNVTKQVDAAVMLSTIWEVVGLNLDQDTSYSDWGFMLFSTVPPGKYWDSTPITPGLLPAKSFPVHNSFIVLPFDIILFSYWQCHSKKATPSNAGPCNWQRCRSL